MLASSNSQFDTPLLILLVGGLVVLSILARWKLDQIGLPSLLGYLGFGIGLRLIDRAVPILTPNVMIGLGELAELGIVALLFQVGMKSHLDGLLRQLRRARLIWFGNVVFSGLCGFAACYWVLHLPLVPCLYVTVALTATSVGIPVSVWTETNRMQSDDGELMLDVAELDDVSAVLLIAVLVAVIPTLNESDNGATLQAVITTGGWVLLKFAFFGVVCLLFSKYAERPMTRFSQRIEPLPDAILMIAGVGFMIAALAGLLGMSMALGAFFAGLIFSRDEESANIDVPYDFVYHLLTPFFFIGIGLHINVDVLSTAIVPGFVLIVAAVTGKVIGTLAPALRVTTAASAWLLAISMVPRAEIAMLVMDQGRQLGPRAVPPELYTGMVLVCAVTSTVAPIVLRRMLGREAPATS